MIGVGSEDQSLHTTLLTFGKEEVVHGWGLTRHVDFGLLNMSTSSPSNRLNQRIVVHR